MIFEDKTYEENHYIALSNAQFRKSIVENVKYDVTLAFPKGDFFFGHYQASIDFKEIPSKTFCLDFRGIKIANLKINGQAIQNTVGDD